MMSNGGGGGGAGDGKGNVNGGGRKRDHQQVEKDEEEEEHEALMKKFPTGYRFKPTDEELIKHYLSPKVNKIQLPLNLIKDVNIYEFHPSELSGKYKSYEDNEFYFFTPRERKYQNGVRPNRAANGGYWKASGTDEPIKDTITNKEIGFKRSLVFYHGKPPKPDSKKAENLRDTKSEWLMHEYTLEKLKDQQKAKRHFNDAGSSNPKQLNEFILCKLYMKPDKSKKDIKYPVNHDQCEDKVVDVAPPSSIANETSSAAAVPEDVAQMGMIPFKSNYNYLDNDNLSFLSAPSAMILPSVDEHYYGEMDQHQLQPAGTSVNHNYNGEMNQHQLQPAVLHSVNHHYNVEMSQQQLQPAGPSVNDNYNGEMNQHQLQPAVLHSVNHHYNVEMSQQPLQTGILPYQHGQMNQQQFDEAYVFEMLMSLV